MLDNIDYVVFLMLENRSFDSILGWLYKDERPSKFVGDDATPSTRVYRPATTPTSTPGE
jgi:phospholipase C